MLPVSGARSITLTPKNEHNRPVIRSNPEENALVRSLVLMSTMSTAADVVSGMAERRRGLDPTTEESPDIARPYLRAAADDLDDHLVALRAGRALRGAESSPTLPLARSINEVLLLNRLTRLFHGIHQRLLSLYPSVPEELVEQARILQGVFADERDRFGRKPTSGLVEEAEIFNVALRALVSSE